MWLPPFHEERRQYIDAEDQKTQEMSGFYDSPSGRGGASALRLSS